MTELLADPAWKVSALLAAAFGGFLTIWIAKLFKWFVGIFSAKNRDLWRQAKAQVEARREAVIAHLCAHPSLLVLNILHFLLIVLLVLGASIALLSVPALADAIARSRAEMFATFCPPSDSLLSWLSCPTPNLYADFALSDKNIVRYYWLVLPGLLFALVLFFAWAWKTAFWLLKASRRALGDNSATRLWF